MSSRVAIRSEGGLIPADTIDKVLREELSGQAGGDFGLDKNRRLSDEIARAWSDTLDYWHIFRRRMAALPASDPGTTLTRERWILLLMSDLLGYELTYQPAGAQVGGKTYPISHRCGAGDEVPPVHIVGFRQDLDRRDESGHRRMSPHALVQEYINRSEHLWGAVSNGLRFRLLRDTTRTARPTYLEFDLQSMLDNGRFNEFAIFYRLCHRTRLPKNIADANDCLLEQYYQASLDEGLRIRDRLRDAVEVALTRIGTGLLQHPDNEALREKVTSNRLPAESYYRQLLRLVYRLLFLMVAEERQMLLVLGADTERRQNVYDRLYSLRRLRDLAERPIEDSLYGDLWTGLQATFGLFANGRENPLGIPPLNGYLFGPEAILDLDGTCLYNHDLLVGIRRMSVFETDGAPARVNYSGLDVEELGSVYESLLDFYPAALKGQNGALVFELRAGTERKSTGSYYTPRELVGELVESALVPVLEERLTKAKVPEEKEQAVSTMTVCDPACGSGHFLLAAARRMARELAKVRSGEDEPTPEEFRRALRDVIQRCMYGVDKNPLAVDLCKVALWIEGHNPGLPLNFLDHHIKCGDSLVGLSSTDALAEGIPSEAFKDVFGDDKTIAKALRQRNANERRGAGTQVQLLFDRITGATRDLVAVYTELDRLPESTVGHIHEKERRYRDIHGEGSSWWTDWTAANLGIASFFMPLTVANAGLVPTTRDLRDFLEEHGVAAKVDAANSLSKELRFFHWPIEFPSVFARGGFDVVLGNPPWERIKLQEEEFFAARDRRIAEAARKADRERLIKELPDKNPILYEEYVQTKQVAEAQSKFIRASGRYSLTAVGDINTYALFAELGRSLMGPQGRMGMVVPTGIGTDDTCKDFFGDLVEKRELASLYDFENRKGLFPSVDSRYRFCLLTLSRQPAELAGFAFFLHRARDLADERRRFSMPPGDLTLFNPNTRTCPTFRTPQDAALTRSVHERIPVLVNERTGDNRWGISFLTMFHLANDSHLFKDQPGPGLLPLYEGKMVGLYDHRAASVKYVPSLRTRQNQPVPTRPDQYRDREFRPTPLWWIRSQDIEERLRDWPHPWLLGFKDITSATNERTMIAAILPRVGVGHNCPIVISSVVREDAIFGVFLLANFNSLVFDYLARQKVGGLHLTYFILKQCPVLPPDSADRRTLGFVRERVVRLVYVSSDMELFARQMGYDKEPFVWDSDDLSHHRAELDACFAHIYGLSRDELRYVLDPRDVEGVDFPGETFRVLRENEEREHGEYRTRRLVLEAYDVLAETNLFGGRVIVTVPHNPLREDR